MVPWLNAFIADNEWRSHMEYMNTKSSKFIIGTFRESAKLWNAQMVLANRPTYGVRYTVTVFHCRRQCTAPPVGSL